MKSDGVRSRLVARDFEGGDKGRDDLFAATPPLESKRLLLSRAATRVNGRLTRKLLFTDAKKAHLNPECKEDVYIELPDEAEGGPGMCAKLNFWLYGFRPAARWVYQREGVLSDILSPGEGLILRSAWRRFHLLRSG